MGRESGSTTPESTRDVARPDVAPEIVAIASRTSSPMVILDGSGIVRYANPAAGQLVGASPDVLAGHDVLALVHPNDRSRVSQDLAEVVAGGGRGEPVEYRIRSATGSWKTVAAVASNLSDLTSTVSILVSATDVTEQRAQERSLRELALHDPVTGLANRLALRERLEAQMNFLDPMAVIFVDLDHFRQINECLGHTVGDAVLQVAGARLRSLVPPSSMVAHFGADTFVVVLSEVGPERAVRLAWELLARVGAPLFIGDRELTLTATIGIAMRDRAATPESILRDADAALTRAKGSRRGGVEVFTDAMRTEAVNRLALETDLRRAIDQRELSLHLQPVVRLKTGRAEGGEVLTRWIRNGEPVDPAVFIPLAEQTGLIAPLGEWVLAGGVAAVADGRAPRVSVNLSPRQLLDPGLPTRVERLLAARSVDAEKVSFEVTEAVLIENFDAATESLQRLRRLGCSVGLDDFGTGYSSLGYLRRLPVDFLKLDRQLVSDIDRDSQAAQIAATIVTLARTLSLTTIAEGVERPAQSDALAAMGCDYGQGWLYGHPEPV